MLPQKLSGLHQGRQHGWIKERQNADRGVKENTDNRAEGMEFEKRA
jgi:hypothetical protein